MTRIKSSPVLLILGAVAVLAAALVGAPALMASLSASDDAVVVEQTSPDASDGECAQAPPGATEVPGCKDCKGRPFCTCSYNGHPRVSCNPCCYSTPSGLICRD
ncbi:MAG: hypothetical protein ACREAA_10965 [Candidatus Polarisedimenticolia bacterium]